MAVMQVGAVRVLVRQGLVAMTVRVRLSRRIAGRVVVSMVHVVDVSVLVLDSRV